MESKKDKIEVIVKEPGKPMYKKMIRNELEEFQDIVEGFIETIPVDRGGRVGLICNEEGKLLDLPPNFIIGSDIIMGNAVFVGVDGEVFADCPATRTELMLLVPCLRLDEGAI